ALPASAPSAKPRNPPPALTTTAAPRCATWQGGWTWKRDAGYAMRDAGYEMIGSRFATFLPNAPEALRFIPYRVSRIPHPVSRIPNHPAIYLPISSVGGSSPTWIFQVIALLPR